MIYALNLFNLIMGKEDLYRMYSARAGKIIKEVSGRIVNSGYKPIRHLAEDTTRSYFIVVEFPSEEAFEHFYQEAQAQNLHKLREESTSDYIWTLYEPWDIRQWLSAS